MYTNIQKIVSYKERYSNTWYNVSAVSSMCIYQSELNVYAHTYIQIQINRYHIYIQIFINMYHIYIHALQVYTYYLDRVHYCAPLPPHGYICMHTHTFIYIYIYIYIIIINIYLHYIYTHYYDLVQKRAHSPHPICIHVYITYVYIYMCFIYICVSYIYT